MAGAAILRAEQPSQGVVCSALRQTREAVVEIDDQLGEILTDLRTPGARISPSAPDRLRQAAMRASEAMASLPVANELFA
jgi:hypothetical protein